MNLAFSTALSYTKRQGRHQSWDLGRAASCLLRLACESCRAGMTRLIFLLGPSTAHGTATRLRVVSAQARPSRCDTSDHTRTQSSYYDMNDD
jgi:hypothetical protein